MKRLFIFILSSILCFSGCSRIEQPLKQKEDCVVTWVMDSSEVIPENNIKVLNTLLKEKGYDFSVKFEYLESDLMGEKPDMYRDALEKMISKKQADIAFLGWEYEVAPGLCTKFLRKRYSFVLDEWLQTEEGKKLYELYDKEIWDTCKVDGKIVAFPNERHVYSPATVVGFNKEYFTKQQVENWDGSWDGLYQMMKKTKLPDGVYMMKGFPELIRFTQTKAGENYIMQDKLVYDLRARNFTNLFEVDAFYEYMNFLNKCWKDGYLFDVNMGYYNYSDEVYESMEQGNYAVDISADSNYPDENVIYVEAPSYMVENNLGTQTVVVENAPHLEEALHLMVALRTDDELANALLYGKEGEAYAVNESGKIIGDIYPAGEWSIGLADGILPLENAFYDNFRGYKKEVLKSEKRLSSTIVGFYPDYSKEKKDMSSYLKLIQKYENCWQDKDFNKKYQEGKEKMNKQTKELLKGVNSQLRNWREKGE